MTKKAKPVEEISDNLGGIGAAIASRVNRIADMRMSLEQKETATGRRVTPHMAGQFRVKIDTMERELKLLYQRRETALAAYKSPKGADASDWE